MNRAASDNPLGLGLVMVGAAALAIATFLPLMQPTGAFRMVEDNTFIQHGGWMLIALALGIAASGYRASRGSRTTAWVAIVLCIIAAGLIVLNANDKDLRTLYPVRPDGTVDTSQPGMVASLGIAIYVAGAGVAIALIGSLMVRQSANQAPHPLVETWSEAATKKCPDCAETVLADARVCKHCGYRFAPAAHGKAGSKPTSPEPQPRPKPPAKPHKTTEVRPRMNPPMSTNALRPGDRVEVVAPGDDHHRKVGKVNKVLHTGYVAVRFGLWEYPFRPDQLKRLAPPTK